MMQTQDTQTTTTEPSPSQPQRSRAVFSQQDFELIRVAIGHYMQTIEDRSEAVKYSNLYHRLGRVA